MWSSFAAHSLSLSYVNSSNLISRTDKSFLVDKYRAEEKNSICLFMLRICIHPGANNSGDNPTHIFSTRFPTKIKYITHELRFNDCARLLWSLWPTDINSYKPTCSSICWSTSNTGAYKIAVSDTQQTPERLKH